jgi:hypothetical protein
VTTILDIPETVEVPQSSRGLYRLEEIAARRAALGHVVASVKFGAHRRLTCRCGATFDGRDDESMASEFSSHVHYHRRRVAPVEIVSP